MPDKNRKRAKHQSPEAEVQHLAETTDLSPNQARELIRRIGNDRDELNAAASRLFRK